MRKKVKLMMCLSLITLITLAYVSGTYAKYVSSIDMSDEARVAIWDLNITRDVDLFKDSYIINKNGEEYAYVKSFGCKNVLNENGEYNEVCDNVIAPGTSGEYKFTIKGRPETNYRIKLDVIDKVDTVGQVKFYLDKDDPNNIFSGPFNIEELARAIEMIYSKNDVFPATKSTDVSHTISWKWDFEINDKEDKKDTDKGSAAIINEQDEGYNDQAKIKLTVKVTAEQTTDAATRLLD